MCDNCHNLNPVMVILVYTSMEEKYPLIATQLFEPILCASFTLYVWNALTFTIKNSPELYCFFCKFWFYQMFKCLALSNSGFFFRPHFFFLLKWSTHKDCLNLRRFLLSVRDPTHEDKKNQTTKLSLFLLEDVFSAWCMPMIGPFSNRQTSNISKTTGCLFRHVFLKNEKLLISWS